MLTAGPEANIHRGGRKPQARSGFFINVILTQDLAPSVTSKQNMHTHNIK